MLVKTKYFGEINLSEDKIITMERGMFGFEEYKKYTILFDSEKEGKANSLDTRNITQFSFSKKGDITG